MELPLDDERLRSQPVFFGGPVQLEHGFVLHRPLRRLALHAAVSESRPHHLARHPRGHGPRRRPGEMLVALGYAGWGAGQLEDEIKRNGWLTVGADPT